MRLTRTFNICFTHWRTDLSKNAYRNIAIYLTYAHENSKCNLHRNVTAIRYRNDVIRSVLLHIGANLGMMLVRDYESCHTARNTLEICVANNCKKILTTCCIYPNKGLCTIATTKSQGVHACYSLDV